VSSLDWMKSVGWLSSIGHVMAGMLVVLVTALFTHREDHFVLVECLFMVYVLVKEYIVDLHFESDEDVLSSTIDAAGYVGGNLLGLSLLAWAHAVGGW
jgi:hypothetical protein